MKRNIKIVIFCFICFFTLHMKEVKAATKEEMPYEINSIIPDNGGFTIKGWALMANTQHFYNGMDHSYTLILTSGSQVMRIPAYYYSVDQSDLMRVQGVRRCGENEYGVLSDYCWYTYQNVGFQAYVPYDKLEMNREYRVDLEIHAKSAGVIKTVSLYHPTKTPVTHIKGQYEYRAISALEDTSLKVTYSKVMVRKNPGNKNDIQTTSNVCSYSYGNRLYYQTGAVFNSIYERRVVNKTTYYRVMGREGGCESNRRVINEGTAISPAWIPSSFVDYGGKQLIIKTNINNTPPVLTIIENPTVRQDQLQGFNPLNYVKAHDKEEGDLTKKIVKVSGEVGSELGKYELVFKVSDKFGASDQKKMIVTVCEPPNTPPEIHAQDKVIYQYLPFDYYKDVSAYDKEDGDLTSKLWYQGFVDIDHLGIYEVTYRVKDSKNLETVKPVKIQVVKNPREKIRYISKRNPWYHEKTPLNWKKKYNLLMDQLKNNQKVLETTIDMR